MKKQFLRGGIVLVAAILLTVYAQRHGVFSLWISSLVLFLVAGFLLPSATEVWKRLRHK